MDGGACVPGPCEALRPYPVYSPHSRIWENQAGLFFTFSPTVQVTIFFFPIVNHFIFFGFIIIFVNHLKQFIPSIPTSKNDSIVEQLREDSATPLLLGTVGFGIVLILFGDEIYQSAWCGSVIGLFLMCLALLGIWIRGKSVIASIWLMLVSWIVSIGLSIFWQPALPIMIFFTLPALAGILTLGWMSGMGLTLGIIIGISIFVIKGWGNLDSEDLWFAVFLFVPMLTIVAIIFRSYQQVFYWLVKNYHDSRVELEVARDRQGELGQALHDLAEANAQMLRLNQLLNTARQQASEAERVKAEFVANVSHELRTPLNMVLGYCEMIMNVPAAYEKRLPPKLMADIAAIQRNSQHLTGLINDVLDISQIEAHKMILNKEWLELPELLREALLAVQPLLESRDLYLKIEIQDDLPQVYCDRTRIRQVLLNLLSNAARFTEVGGITVSAEAKDGNIKVIVSDTGPGIAEVDIPKLFQPFRQLDGSTRRKQNGSGLGLNISKNFIELHGGRMGVESEIGVGSSFWFSIPIITPVKPESGFNRWLSSEYDQIRHPTTSIRQRILPRILILEKDEYLAGYARQYEKDIDVVWVSDPDEARQVIDENPVSAVLIRCDTDQQMSTWSQTISQSNSLAPVIECLSPKRIPGESLGVNNYLVKPVHYQQLLETIRSVERPINSILLVDDDPETLQLFSRLLSAKPHRYRILQADNGLEALHCMTTRNVDLVILDLIMPGMDGYTVLREKQSSPAIKDIPVIILTADDPEERLPSSVPTIKITHRKGFSFHELYQISVEVSDVLSNPS
ncbi:signal transduction histidine kinase [Anaerolinea thermolimosa]|nr:signal transduction histidine kinase [Anaerolinea thermolimosa]